MTNVNRSPAQLSIAPEMPRGEVVARYRTYAEAQEAVDYMSDEHFPVAMVSIIGSDLKSVEQVTGRLSYPRVALQGALNGLFFGAFFGLVMSMFGGAEMTSSLLLTMLLGGAFFMLMATISHAMSRGKRDFTSTSRIVAGSYEVLAAPEVAGQARQVLAGMHRGRPTGPRGPVPGSNPSGPAPQGGVPQGPHHGGSHGGDGPGPAQGGVGDGPRASAPQQPAQSFPHGAGGTDAPGEPVRSAQFPDLPDGRPQYGIRIDQQQGRPAPWGGAEGSTSAQGQDHHVPESGGPEQPGGTSGNR